MNNASAYVLGESATRLWGLTARQRIARQISEVDGVTLVDDPEALSADKTTLLLRADFLFETRTLAALARESNTLLVPPDVTEAAAAVADPAHLQTALGVLEGKEPIGAGGLSAMNPSELQAFDQKLRRSEPPLLEQVSEGRRQALEDRLYGNSYKGITDLVTKWLWPRPARAGVRFCTLLGITPNAVTGLSLLLMLAACWLFWRAEYGLGLALGWFMTYLDTVDGKLARVTVTSSRIGHVMDHGMDVIHPPFWYVFWGLSLIGFSPVFGLDQNALCWIVVAGYWLGRVVEGAFELFLGCEMFSWRPLDAWFRLITARRNPCLILLTAGYALGRPDWGFVAVVGWTALTSALLVLRLAYAVLVRFRSGPLRSWLSDADQARRCHPFSYRTFSGTRAAYGGA
ncbi:MAG: CDP-alcohol phosphatidyltransferase family protein [Gammaproteobacteria bacterium]|jgi:phosphatidylglycerophosphate synthase